MATVGLIGLFEEICLAANSACVKSSLMLIVVRANPFHRKRSSALCGTQIVML
jgi:hypothetical protein